MSYLVTITAPRCQVHLEYDAPSSAAALQVALADFETFRPGVPANQLHVYVRVQS